MDKKKAQFELDKQGYPLPGKVIKYYREQMKYIDPVDKKEKYWTQADLAKKLGIKELMVRLMETQNKGLDSIERRRTLALLLNIPLTLLGLASLDEIVAADENNHSNINIITCPSSSKGIDMVGLYQDVFNAYYNIGLTNTHNEYIHNILTCTNRLENDIKLVNNKQDKSKLLYVLWQFHNMITDVYAYDFHDWNKTQKHIRHELDIAKELNDANLLALSLNQSCEIRIMQENKHFATIEIDAAMNVSKKASPLVKAVVYAYAARAYIVGGYDLGERTSSSGFIEKAEKFLNLDNNTDGGFIPLRVTPAKALFTQLDAIRDLGEISNAKYKLSQIEETIPSDDKLKIVHFHSLQAQCELLSKRPDYAKVIAYLSNALELTKVTDITPHNNKIADLWSIHNKISDSPYGNAPEVVNLGLEIRELRARKPRKDK